MKCGDFFARKLLTADDLDSAGDRASNGDSQGIGSGSNFFG